LDTVNAPAPGPYGEVRSREEKLAKGGPPPLACLRTLAFNVPDLICTFDLDGRFTRANPAGKKSLPEITGKDTFDLAVRIRDEVNPVLTSKQPIKKPVAARDITERPDQLLVANAGESR
jgi:hypothetical protein